jgi:ribonuclease HII
VTSALPRLDVEQELVARGFTVVIGLDEVGRGALAGPVSVGAVAWWPGAGTPPEGIRDSKLVPEKSRDALAASVKQWVSLVAVGHAEPEEIDRSGIVASLGVAAVRAVSELVRRCAEGTKPIVLLDGSQDWLSKVLPTPIPVVTKVKADRDCLSVAAASLVAKVERDSLMRGFAATYPEYGFDSHKGYGSAKHMAALRKHGLSPLHRRSFVHPERLFASSD